jgi:uncharacterized membrane protein YozB (DUF420 family)
MKDQADGTRGGRVIEGSPAPALRPLPQHTAGLAEDDQRIPAVVLGALSLLVVGAVAWVVTRTGGAGTGARGASALPTVNAVLNGISTLLLIAGYAFIRRRRVLAHQACMLSAFAVSSLFLITYLLHHYWVGSVPFSGTGWMRTLYFAILVPHVLLSAFIPALALTTIYAGWHGRLERHVRIARWTLPIWLYVSVSGVVVYWMLYHLGR